jgi:hypothetical protein
VPVVCDGFHIDSNLTLHGFLFSFFMFFVCLFSLLLVYLTVFSFMFPHLLSPSHPSVFTHFDFSSSFFLSHLLNSIICFFFFLFFYLFLFFHLLFFIMADEGGSFVSIYVLVFFLMSFLHYLHSSSIFSHHPKYVFRFITYLSSEIILFFPWGSFLSFILHPALEK